MRNFFLSQEDDIDIPNFINIDGEIKKNKWNIPSLLNNEQKKALIQVKKKAYQLDQSFLGCCVGLDPIIGDLLTFFFNFITKFKIKKFTKFLGFLPIIGDFAGVGLSILLINYIKSTNLVDNNLMIGEMTFNVFKDALVRITYLFLFYSSNN